MKDFELKDIDSEDMNDFLMKIETSFDIKFLSNELVYITTFGELCDHIVNKIQLENSDDCTSQQAFYKLRNAISSTLQLENKTIATNLLLAEILPQQNRRSTIKKLGGYFRF